MALSPQTIASVFVKANEIEASESCKAPGFIYRI